MAKPSRTPQTDVDETRKPVNGDEDVEVAEDVAEDEDDEDDDDLDDDEDDDEDES
jgi:hypothetical protein